jgi:hypothetical protein
MDCNYSPQDLESWCQGYAADFFKAAKEIDSGQTTPQEIWDGIFGTTDLFDRRLMAQIKFKSHQFEVEREVRLYKFGYAGERCWRASRGGNYVVPYLEVDLPNESVLTPLSAGPNHDNLLAGASCAAVVLAGIKSGTKWDLATSGGSDSGFRVGL